MSGVEDGRYVYCVVSLADEAATTMETTGVADRQVGLVAADDIGAVVHEHTTPLATPEDDLAEMRRRLLAHQSVVDAAADRFGTPLPVRFGTVLKGGDSGVRAWLNEKSEALSEALSSLAGRREYRVEVEWATDALDVNEEALDDIDERLTSATEGESYLLERERERRETELRRERREELTAALVDRLDDVGEEVEVRELGERRIDVGEGETNADARLAVLAPESAESAVGDVLDAIEADAEAVRFTGPWPPYTFAPDLDG